MGNKDGTIPGICLCYFPTINVIINVVSVMVLLKNYFATRSVKSFQETSSHVNLSSSSSPDCDATSVTNDNE